MYIGDNLHTLEELMRVSVNKILMIYQLGDLIYKIKIKLVIRHNFMLYHHSQNK